MAIPALIGTDIPLDETTDGVMAVVDGSDGTIYVDPDEETMALMQEKKRADEEKKALLQPLSFWMMCSSFWMYLKIFSVYFFSLCYYLQP